MVTLAYHAASWADMVPHLATLTRLAGDARTIVEFGVRGGVSTWALLDGLPDDGQMVSVDIDEDVPAKLPERVTADPRWRLVIADDRAPDIQASLPSHADLVFIDTSHEYHHTLRELEIARRLGATTVALHDYALADVEDAVLGWLRRNRGTLTVEQSEWGLAVIAR